MARPRLLRGDGGRTLRSDGLTQHTRQEVPEIWSHVAAATGVHRTHVARPRLLRCDGGRALRSDGLTQHTRQEVPEIWSHVAAATGIHRTHVARPRLLRGDGGRILRSDGLTQHTRQEVPEIWSYVAVDSNWHTNTGVHRRTQAYTEHTWHVHGCCGVTGDGLYEAMDSLSTLVKKYQRSGHM